MMIPSAGGVGPIVITTPAQSILTTGTAGNKRPEHGLKAGWLQDSFTDGIDNEVVQGVLAGRDNREFLLGRVVLDLLDDRGAGALS